jgi:Trypsin-co-occurring domain 1
MYARVPLEDGQEFFVDVGPAGDGVVRAGRTDVAIKSSAETFEASLGRVRSIAAMLVEQLSGLPAAPDHIRAEFGISLALETGMVVVKGTGEAHFVIELEWSRKQEG